MIGITSSGSFDKTFDFLEKAQRASEVRNLDAYGQQGVAALARATPEDTGETANSWDFRIIRERGRVRIEWFNTNVVDGVPIAVIVQYGHGTGTGGWVEGEDYINPAMKPVFAKIANDVWKEVKQ